MTIRFEMSKVHRTMNVTGGEIHLIITIIIFESLLYSSYKRNKKQRHSAKEEHHRIAHGKIETQVFHARCSQPPDILTSHPFEPHLAVALKDHFRYFIFNIILLNSPANGYCFSHLVFGTGNLMPN